MESHSYLSKRSNYIRFQIFCHTKSQGDVIHKSVTVLSKVWRPSVTSCHPFPTETTINICFSLVLPFLIGLKYTLMCLTGGPGREQDCMSVHWCWVDCKSGCSWQRTPFGCSLFSYNGISRLGLFQTLDAWRGSFSVMGTLEACYSFQIRLGTVFMHRCRAWSKSLLQKATCNHACTGGLYHIYSPSNIIGPASSAILC